MHGAMSGMESRQVVWLCYLLLFNSKLLECSSVKHITTAMFEKFPNKKAIAIPIETKETRLEIICHQSCLANPICLSFNIAIQATMEFICEMFDMKLRIMEQNLIPSNTSDFYDYVSYSDCQVAQAAGITLSDLVLLRLPDGKFVRGSCDMETAGGGWTVLQRRQDGSVDFDLPREDYKAGFGNLLGEFWFGLQAMHEMTASSEYTIRFDLWNGNDHRYAEYKNVRIGNEAEFYKITFGSYSGTAGNSLYRHKEFTTKDLDRDISNSNCAVYFRSGWWWNQCHPTGLNSFAAPGTCNWHGMVWAAFNGECTLTKSEIKIRK